jgi:hypothetical protein
VLFSETLILNRDYFNIPNIFLCSLSVIWLLSTLNYSIMRNKSLCIIKSIIFYFKCCKFQWIFGETNRFFFFTFIIISFTSLDFKLIVFVYVTITVYPI